METTNNGYDKAYYDYLKDTLIHAVNTKTGWGKKDLLNAIAKSFFVNDHPPYVYGIYHTIRARMPKEAKNIGSKQAEKAIINILQSTQAFLERTKGIDLSHRDYDPFFLHKSLSEKIISKPSWGKNQLSNIILDSTLNGQHYPDKVYKAHFLAAQQLQNGKANISTKDALALLNKCYKDNNLITNLNSNTMENQNNETKEKKEAVQLDGFLTKEPKIYTYKDKEHAMLQIGVKKDGSDEKEYHSVKVSDKFIDSVKDLKKGTEITIKGYPNTDKFPDKETGEEKEFSYIQAATNIQKLVKTVTLAGNISSEISEAQINGKDNKFFSMAVNNENGKAEFHNIRVSEKFFASLSNPDTKTPLKTGDFVQVQGFPKSYEGQNKEGQPEQKHYVQLSSDVKLLKAIDKKEAAEKKQEAPEADAKKKKGNGKNKNAAQSPAL